VSTLFPQLPRADMWAFRVALAGGAAVVVVLAAFRLLPIALLAAALLVPLLTLLYLRDVDLYEDDPVWAVASTLVWGAVTGVGVGLLARSLAPTGSALLDKGSTAHVVTGGVLLPLLGVVLMLAGPLAMLPYRRFNDVLDGATFGAVSAAAFAGAEAVVYGVDVLGGGLRPVGEALPWIWRLLAISVALPVVAMAAVGFAAGALWLRYRAPVKDRGALGPLGSPVVAVALAGLLVAGASVGETFLDGGAWLAWIAAFDVVALLLLRRAIHVGLLEEAAEKPIGPPIACANCGASTPSHSFCSNCGISLAALPKPRGAAAPGTGPAPAPGPPSEAGA
jgi:RsiW-degrading membrane proteinase PrsW (M82 family)